MKRYINHRYNRSYHHYYEKKKLKPIYSLIPPIIPARDSSNDQKHPEFTPVGEGSFHTDIRIRNQYRH